MLRAKDSRTTFLSLVVCVIFISVAIMALVAKNFFGIMLPLTTMQILGSGFLAGAFILLIGYYEDIYRPGEVLRQLEKENAGKDLPLTYPH